MLSIVKDVQYRVKISSVLRGILFSSAVEDIEDIQNCGVHMI